MWLYFSYTATMRGDEKPWIVVSTGVDTERAVRQGQEVEAVVDEIELIGPFEDRGDVKALGHLRVDAIVLLPTVLHHRRKASTGVRVARREQGDVDAAFHQTFGEQRHEQLPRSVVAGRYSPRDRGQHGDAETHVDASR